MSHRRYPITTVTAAEISRNFGEWQSRAMSTPITITHHGRARLVLAAIETFEASGDEPAPRGPSSHDDLNARLHAILSEMQDGFIAFDEHMKVTEANRAAELYVGFARDQLIGHDLRDVVPALKDSIAWDYYGRVLRTGQPVEFKMKSSIHGGPRISVRAFPYESVGVATIFTNLGPFEEAAASERRMEGLHAAFDGEDAMALIRLNVRGGFEVADAAFCAMTGFSAAQLANLLLTDILHPADRPLFTRKLNTALRGRPVKPTQATLIARGGEERVLRFYMSVVQGDPFPDEVVVWVMDVGGLAGGAGA